MIHMTSQHHRPRPHDLGRHPRGHRSLAAATMPHHPEHPAHPAPETEEPDFVDEPDLPLQHPVDPDRATPPREGAV